MVRIIIKVENEGQAHSNVGSSIVEISQVGEYLYVRRAGVLEVTSVVHILDIEEEQIHVRHHLVKDRDGHGATCFDTAMYTLLSGRVQQGPGKPGLYQRFPTREGHPSTGRLVKRLVAYHALHDGVNVHLAANELQRSRPTRLHTDTARFADIAVQDMMSVDQGMRPVWAHPEAIAASDTGFRLKREERARVQPLGIMTPHTSQWTALQKHRRAYPRPIVNGKALYVEYSSRYPGCWLYHVNIPFSS